MNTNAGLKVELELIGKANLPPGMRIEEFEKRVVAAGNTVLRRESDGLILVHQKQVALRMETNNG